MRVQGPSYAGGQRECTIAQALSYRNDEVIYKFLERFDMAFGDAEEVFQETLRWMWLCSHNGAPRLAITQELLILDEMWHTFILFTQPYADYCERYLGKFIHHAPTTQAEKDRLQQQHQEDPETSQRSIRKRMQAQLMFIADHLGPETLVQWFIDFPRRYDSTFFERSTKRPPADLTLEHLAGLEHLASRLRA